MNEHALPHDSARQHVTGNALYVDDVPMPANTLHIATGLAGCAHGDIKRLDLAAVRAAPGVVDVITAADIPGELDVGPVFPGDPLLADGCVEFIGQPIFAVAAETQTQALRAAALADVEYEPRAAVLSVAAALDAELFVLPTRDWQQNDADAALADAAHTLTSELYVRGQEHFYLEGQVAFALPQDDGIYVCTSTQHPSEVQKLVARVLDQPLHRIQIECRRMGGAFGGKESQAAPLACLAALFAERNGRAAKYRMPRRDDMVQTGKRHDFAIRSELGFAADGRITAGRFDIAGKCGYSPDLSEGIVDRAMFHIDNAYFLPASRLRGYPCKTHTVSNTAFRGFGGPQGMLAIEAAMDEAAYALGIDPLTLRKRNLYRPGADRTPYGQKVEQLILPDLIETLENRADYAARRAAIEAANKAANQTTGSLRRGIALTPVKFGISFTTTHLNQAGALVHVYTDGSIEVSHGGTEMGQGLYTKVAQVVARAFGVSRESVRNTATRTDKVPNTSPTAASAAADMNGFAAADACNRIKSALTAYAADYRNHQGELHFAEGYVSAPDGSWREPFADFVKAAYMARTPLSATGFYATPDIHFDKVAGKGRPFYYFAHGAAVSEVEIDITSGAYRVNRVDILHDVGDSLNPAIDRGQIEGGFVQGMGWLTTEELLWDDDGRIISDSPANYKIPVAADCPAEFNVSLYDAPNPAPTIHRSKAVGEPPLMLAISVWCALRDACASLSDYRHLPPLAVPATAEQVYFAARAARDFKGAST